MTDPKYLNMYGPIQLRVLMNIERELLRHGTRCAARQKWLRSPNWVKVQTYLLAGTSRAGKTSAMELCEWLRIDPDAYRITI